MALATVSIPGSNGNFTTLTVEKDAKAALTSAIKNLFNQAAPNITANEIASGVNGMKGFFNLVLDGALASTSITAGANVQALFDTGLGHDTLVGNSATTLFFANNAGDSISSSATASTIIGGTGSDTVTAQGIVSAYLEGGNNQVNLSNGSVSLLGTGGKDTVNVVAGSNTVTAAYKATIDLSGDNTKDKVTLADGSTVSMTGGSVVATITGNNETIYVNGSHDSVNLVGSNDTVIFVGGGNDTITYSSPGKSQGHSATVIGGDGNGQRAIPRSWGAAESGSTIHAGHAVYTHIAGEHNVFTAARQSDTMVGALHDAKGGSDLFKLDASVHSHHTITAFSNQSDTISISHITERQLKVGLAHATITGGRQLTRRRSSPPTTPRSPSSATACWARISSLGH